MRYIPAIRIRSISDKLIPIAIVSMQTPCDDPEVPKCVLFYVSDGTGYE